MFNLLSSAIQSAVETVAPSAPITEDLKYHWRKITHFYATRGASNFTDRVEATSIPSHLREILVLLVEEHAEALIKGGGREESGSQNEPGPCMEAALELRLFRTLAQYASDDWPSGVKCHVLRFFTEILEMGIPASVLPHNAVFGPLKDTIRVCGATNASPYEKEELEFLKAMSMKLTRFSDLAPCFLCRLEEDESPGNPKSVSQTSEPNTKVVDPDKAYFPIVRSFLTLMMSADYGIAVESSRALLEFCSCVDDWLSPALIAPLNIIVPGKSEEPRVTSLPQFIVERIVESFKSLPEDLDPDKLEESNWRELNDSSPSPEEKPSTEKEDTAPMKEKSSVLEPTSMKVMSYLSRLDLADVFAASTPALAAGKIGEAFAAEFLRGCLEPRLMDETDALLATSHLTKVVQQVSSSIFLKEISAWLLGTDRNPELRGVEVHHLKSVLLDRCRQNEDVALALETLRLFEVLLQKPCEPMIYNLALTNLVDRGYVDLRKLESQCSSWSDEEDEREKKRVEALAFSPNSTPRSRTLAPSHIQKIVSTFVEMVPDCLRSCQDEDAGISGATYEQYLADAHRHTRNALGQCRNFAWPREATVHYSAHSTSLPLSERDEEISSSDSRPEADHFLGPQLMPKERVNSGDGKFYEGRFLEMLLSRFEALLDQPYELSLQVTSVLATLAALPHPHLHEFLLNPLLPPAEGARTLPVLLQKIIDEIQIIGAEIPSFHRRLCETRCVLLSGDESATKDELSSIGEKHPSLFEGAIVIEEFCKELGALAFAKYQQCSC